MESVYEKGLALHGSECTAGVRCTNFGRKCAIYAYRWWNVSQSNVLLIVMNRERLYCRDAATTCCSA